MKTFAFAAAGLAAMFSAQTAFAQVYDTLTPAATLNYTTTAGATLGGDILIPTAYGAVCQVDGAFVAVAPGTYNVNVNFYNSRCLGCTPVVVGPFAITIPDDPGIPNNVEFPAGYEVSFTINPAFTWAPVAPETIVGIGFTSSSSDFALTFDNVATGFGTSFNGFSLDLNLTDGCLSPGFAGCPAGAEWYNFTATPAWTNGNLLVRVLTSCPPSPSGPFARQDVYVRRLDLPVKRAKTAIPATAYELDNR